MPPTRSAMPSTMPITISVVPMIQRLRKSSSMTSLRAMPSTTIGSEPRMMNQPIRASSWPRYSGRNSDFGQVDGDPPDVAPEEDEHGELGADLDHRGERRAGVAPAEDLGEDPQVRAAGDRQELGQSLDDAEDDGLEEVHHEAESYGRPPGVPVPPRVAGRLPCRHAAAASRRDRPDGVPARSRHDDLGTRHRRARGARPADRLRRGRRHPRRHRRRLRRTARPRS